MVSINGKEIKQDRFAFDKCHKFYLIANDEEENEALNAGYTVYSIDQIAKEFWNSCPLRFIQTWKDFERIIPQCECRVIFNIDGKEIVEDFEDNVVTEDGVAV